MKETIENTSESETPYGRAIAGNDRPRWGGRWRHSLNEEGKEVGEE